MVTNNKKYRIKWRHHNNATNQQNNPKRPRSFTYCMIIDMENDILVSSGMAILSNKDKNYIKAEGRYQSVKRAMRGFDPLDQVDILNSLVQLPSHKRWFDGTKNI